MIITLIKKEKIFTLYLPSDIKGQFWLSDTNNNFHRKLISIEGNEGKWFIRGNKAVRIINSENKEVWQTELFENCFYSVKITEDDAYALLFAEKISGGRLNFNKYLIDSSAGIRITIGRNDDNSIVFDNKFVSGVHATLMYYNGNWSIQDNQSENGTFINNISIQSAVLKPGDSIYILGLTIIIGSNFISVNNPNNNVKLDSNAFRPYQQSKNDIRADANEKRLEYETEYFYRSPRFKREIEKIIFRINAPPPNAIGEEVPMALLIGPSITMGMASVSTGLFAISNAVNNNNIAAAVPSIVMSCSILLGTVMWPIVTKRYEKKKRHKKERKRQKKYVEYLNDIEAQIQDECMKQSSILLENYVSVAECVDRIDKKQINLWERSKNQNDFLCFRVGLGEILLNAEINYPEKKFTLDDDNLEIILHELFDKPKILSNVPITVSLLEQYITSIIGERENCLSFSNGLILQLISFYGYDEVKTVFIYDEAESSALSYAKWLPHTWDNERSFRFIATNANELKELSAFLEKEIERRIEISPDNIENVTPYYVIFAFSRELALRAEMLKQLYALEKNINISVVCLFDELKNTPKECTAVIELAGENGKIFNKDDTSGQAVRFISDINYKNMRDISIKLANVSLDLSASAYQLPQMLTFLDMFEVNKAEHLNTQMRWKANDPTKSLQTAIGINTLGDIFYLDLHEKFHGPHGLVAGMTGSGKSEFIMTYILSLAVNYHPHEVAFILIDYKGGGMAKSFENLPHVTGIITNLDGASVKRSIVSIESELKHRQEVFVKTSQILSVSNIDIYKYQKAYRDGLVSEPLPHLFIISDEFAELKTQQPDFMTQLVSAARIGRSLGVHLILATQKPSGVVDDQIWSNTRFRICLKVQDRSDSMDMLKRPEAAELSNTGRFYLQVGYNELFELGQSAWAGAPLPAENVSQQKDRSISVIDTNGHIIQTVKLGNSGEANKNSPKQLDAITGYIAKMAKEENIFARKLWLEPIEPVIILGDLNKKHGLSHKENFVLNPLIGEYDDPARQRQMPLYMPISEEGNAIVYGFAGSGKTTFITTALYALLCAHTAETLNIYIMDFGSETLKNFEKAPQIGAVIVSTEAERITNLFKMINGEIVKRKKLFADWGGDYNSYCSQSGDIVPNILLIINNYSAFTENYENCEESVSRLSQEGTKYGIYFVLTANSANAVRYKLLQNFKQIFVLQLNDESDYSGILGNVGGVYPSRVKGRGIIKHDMVYEFQTAYISKPNLALAEIKNLCAEITGREELIYAAPVPILPEKVDIEFLKNVQAGTRRLPVGVNKHTLNIETIDLTASLVTLVASITNSGIDRFAQGLAEILSEKTGAQTIVLDADGFFSADDDKIYKYYTTDLETQIIEMFNLMVARHKQYQGNPDPSFDEVVYIIPNMTGLFKTLSADGADKLNTLLEKGRVEYGVKTVLCDTISNIQSFSAQQWYRIHCIGNGIWIGDGVTDQFQLKISKPPAELYQETGTSFGVIINGGKAKIIKLLQSRTDITEEA